MPPVEIYTTAYCPYCAWAKDLLAKKGVPFKEIDVGGDSALRAEKTARASGRYTLPPIFKGVTHVGGCDDLYTLEDAGKLDPLLTQPGSAA
jgi:glutaredoxin 3